MRGSNYRNDIDGLRAIAIISVVLFHISNDKVTNGFLGVDVFFVISGFLITGIINKEIESKRFSIIHFYQRRIRRLMPALLAMMLIVAGLSLILLLPSDLVGFSKSLIASVFFAGNIYFWRDADYFSTAAELKPLLNLWSLGVEEQFYIFFPILLWMMAKRPRWMLPSMWAIVLISLGLHFFLSRAGGDTPAFYLLPTRAWELGAGAVVALSPQRMQTPFFDRPIRLISLALIGLGLIYTGPWPENVPVALPVVIGTAMLIWVGAGMETFSGRLLATPAVNFVGQISYSLYLWHWPIIVLAKYYLIHEMGMGESILAGIVSVFVATLSWHYVERPFRSSRTGFCKVAWIAGTGTILVLVVGTGIVIAEGFPGRLTQEAAAINRSVDTNYRCPVSQMFPFGASRACGLTLNGKSAATAETVLFGNSHAQMYAPVVKRVLERRRRPGILVPINGCLPMVSVNISVGCFKAAEANLGAVLALPTVREVIVAFNWRTDQELFGRDGRQIKGNRLEALVAGVDDLIARMHGKKVVLVGPIASPGTNIASILSRQIAYGKQPRIPISADGAAFRQRFRPVFAAFENDHRIRFLRPDRIECPGKTCDFVRDELSLFADSNHLAQPALPLFEPMFEQGLAKTVSDLQPRTGK